MCEHFTRVEIAFYPEYLNCWLRFGDPDERHELDRRRSIALFKPGSLFGYVCWQANEYGTQIWRFTIVQTHQPSRLLSRIEGVLPGGEVLLLVTGKAKIKRAFSQIDQLEKDGFEPAEVSPAYYRHIHNRVTSGQEIRGYTKMQHDAHLAARNATS